MHFFTTYADALPGAGFSLFDISHILWLMGGGIGISFSAIRYRASDRMARRRILRRTAAALLLSEILRLLLLFFRGLYADEYLPMHLCSLCLWVVLGYALHFSADAGEFLYAVALPCAAAALLFPGWTELPPFGFLSIHSFVYHFLLLDFVLLPLCAGEIQPDFRRLPEIFSLLCLLAVLAHTINFFCQTNFFFLEDPGSENPLAAAARFLSLRHSWILFVPTIALTWFSLYGGYAAYAKIRAHSRSRVPGLGFMPDTGSPDRAFLWREDQ